jgi:hypothetical protein
MSAAIVGPWPVELDLPRIDPRLALRLFDRWVCRLVEGPAQPIPPITLLMAARDALTKAARDAAFTPIPLGVLRGVLDGELDVDGELSSLRREWESEWTP